MSILVVRSERPGTMDPETTGTEPETRAGPDRDRLDPDPRPTDQAPRDSTVPKPLPRPVDAGVHLRGH